VDVPLLRLLWGVILLFFAKRPRAPLSATGLVFTLFSKTETSNARAPPPQPYMILRRVIKIHGVSFTSSDTQNYFRPRCFHRHE